MKKFNFFLAVAITFIAVDTKAQLTVLNNGNVGIGTTEPGSKLQVIGGTIRSDLGTGVTGASFVSTGEHSNFQILHDGTTYLGIRNSAYYAGMKFYAISADYPLLHLDFYAERVGVATSDPQYTLDVNGDIGTYGGLQVYSDERIKEDINPLTNCLAKLNKINGKSYIKKPNPNTLSNKNSKASVSDSTRKLSSTLVNRPEFGVIAQELKSVFPELVKEDGHGLLTVNYIGLIPVIIEAMKEQKKYIDAQTLKIKELEERLSSSESKADNVTTKNAQTPNNDSENNAVLQQNTPNPFNQNTEIKYYLPENIQSAELYVYNMQGSQIKNVSIQTRGYGSTIINGNQLKAGMYLYTLIADNKEIGTKRMILTE